MPPIFLHFATTEGLLLLNSGRLLGIAVIGIQQGDRGQLGLWGVGLFHSQGQIAFLLVRKLYLAVEQTLFPNF